MLLTVLPASRAAFFFLEPPTDDVVDFFSPERRLELLAVEESAPSKELPLVSGLRTAPALFLRGPWGLLPEATEPSLPLTEPVGCVSESDLLESPPPASDSIALIYISLLSIVESIGAPVEKASPPSAEKRD
jgi:hypothetical protein